VTRRRRTSLDVAVRVELELALDERGRGLVADGVEEAVDGQVARLARLEVLDRQALQQLAIALGLDRGGVVEHGALVESA